MASGVEIKSSSAKALSELETCLKKTIYHLGAIVRFHADVLAMGVQSFVSSAPTSSTGALKMEQARFNRLLDAIENELTMAKAVLERDLRKLDGQTPLPSSVLTPSASITTPAAVVEDVAMSEASTPAQIFQPPPPASATSLASQNALLASFDNSIVNAAVPPALTAQSSSISTAELDLDALLADFGTPSDQPLTSTTSTMGMNDIDDLLASFSQQPTQASGDMGNIDIDQLLQGFGLPQ